MVWCLFIGGMFLLLLIWIMIIIAAAAFFPLCPACLFYLALSLQFSLERLLLTVCRLAWPLQQPSVINFIQFCSVFSMRVKQWTTTAIKQILLFKTMEHQMSSNARVEGAHTHATVNSHHHRRHKRKQNVCGVHDGKFGGDLYSHREIGHHQSPTKRTPASGPLPFVCNWSSHICWNCSLSSSFSKRNAFSLRVCIFIVAFEHRKFANNGNNEFLSRNVRFQIDGKWKDNDK